MKENDRINASDHQRRGFTAIEIIFVLIIIGALLAIAVSRIDSTKSVSAITERDILKSHLRYVQLRALSDIKPWGISFHGSYYKVLRDGTDAVYTLPNENSATHTLPNGITATGSTVTFDEWGSPGPDSVTITVSPGGGTITVSKITGFVE